MAETLQLFVGNIVHCEKPYEVSSLEKGFVALKGNKIVSVGDATSLANFRATIEVKYNILEYILKDSQVLIPGLIDTHVHACQYSNVGLGMDLKVVPWLWEHTFPLELKCKDIEYSRRCYDAVVKKALDYGTTTASYNAAIYTDSALVLADSVIKHGQRALVGKVNHTRQGPDYYVETHKEFIDETRRFIEEIQKKKSSLVQAIITPRSPTCSDLENMELLIGLGKEFGLRVQTHLKESLEGFKVFTTPPVKNPNCKTKIFPKKTIYAHCVHLSEEEIQALVNSESTVSHCPNSNVNLRSGICDVRALIKAGIHVGLGTDVSGGCSLSLMNAMRYAVACSNFLSFGKDNYEPIGWRDAFYMATLGGAKVLDLDKEIGNFEVGKEFDAVIIDMNVKDGPIDYLEDCSALETLQKFIYAGDDRNVVSVYVAGRKVK
ncbi:hypothetical protein PPYR_01709 [Photinus pyralis]|uniref:Amidohydrolase-related domain-containing protein n=1 Tax=Photinus pyralis TaxID=7054 RepID=A0A1Y1NAB5_PHOPY|nr:guanine deaminase-like [Photinus pyralis]XP_031327791.1 guanine deaminase-like [Photinus pyralis]KAB0804739.1 hypothetical protein PPYR_01709 [Photinus pyralis]